MQPVVLTMATLAGGGAVEHFERELERVLANIHDPNTEAEATRAVVLELRIKPHEDRESGVVEVQCRAKLAPARALVSQVYMGRRDGKLVATTYDPRQGGLFDAEATADVLPLNREGRR